ncbi:MAG: large subunit ribosomal protein L15 [Myxococcota bacterium]|jgi:large subunit ribosomal protein L15
MNELSKLKPPEGAVTRKKRKGRGIGSGIGKTCGRGMKGTKARSKVARGFEGGQMPLHRRLPKRGFSNYPHFQRYLAVNVGRLNGFEDGATIDIDALKRAGIAKGHDVRVKIVGGGELTKKLNLRASRVSAKDARPERSKSDRRSEFVVVTNSAAEAIKAAGGAVDLS